MFATIMVLISTAEFWRTAEMIPRGIPKKMAKSHGCKGQLKRGWQAFDHQLSHWFPKAQ